MLESVGIVAFFVMSLIGFRFTLWWVVAALAAHGVFDWFHGRLIEDPGVPSWWPMFCLTYDVVAAAYLSWLLGFSRIDARSKPVTQRGRNFPVASGHLCRRSVWRPRSAKAEVISLAASRILSGPTCWARPQRASISGSTGKCSGGRCVNANRKSWLPSCSALSAAQSSRRPGWYPKEIQAGEM